MRPVRQLLAVLLMVVFAAPLGCGDPTRETLDRWSGSEAGFKKMEDFAANSDNDRELRLHALELFATNRLGLRARHLIEKARDRDDLATTLADRLMKRLDVKGEPSDEQIAIKESLIVLLRILPDKKRDEVQQAIATWAFGSLAKDADADAVKTHIERRITISQITQLGAFGMEGAALLMSRGFGVEALYDYLHGLKTPEADRKILGAFRKMHSIPDIDIPSHHLFKIQELDIPEAVVYLLELYMNKNAPPDIRGDAFALAIRAFEKPDVRKHPKELLPGLHRILKIADNDDRRLAAHYILRLGGVDELVKVFDGFLDDGAFNIDGYDTPRFARDICRDDVLKLRGDPIPALTSVLKNGNRVSRTLALVCLKLSERVDAMPPLEALSEDETALATDLADLMGEGVTMASLARNAVDAMKAVAGLTQRRDTGRMKDAPYERLRKLYEDELVLTGEELDKAVKERARGQRRKVRRGEELP